jgi:hypothetical protein
MPHPPVRQFIGPKLYCRTPNRHELVSFLWRHFYSTTGTPVKLFFAVANALLALPVYSHTGNISLNIEGIIL